MQLHRLVLILAAGLLSKNSHLFAQSVEGKVALPAPSIERVADQRYQNSPDGDRIG